MKTLNNITLSVLFLALLTIGCQNENIPRNCEGDNAQYLETFYSDEFESVPCGLQNIEDDKKDVNLVITNQIDFETYLSCSAQLPEIDFDTYFILAGRYRHQQCAIFDSQQVSICNNKIVYNVWMTEQDCHAFTNVFYVAVLEQKYNSLQVEFDVQFKN